MKARARGFALVLVLWVGVLLTLVVGSLAFGARTELAVTRGLAELRQAEALAEAGVARAVVGLMERDRAAKWRSDGAPYTFTLAGGKVTVRVRSERGKINLNAAAEDVVRKLFAGAAERIDGVEEEQALAAAEAVLDWRDRDDTERRDGAEARAYAAAGLQWRPANGKFSTVSELRRVLGVSAEIYDAIAPHLTVNGGGARIDPQSASAVALEAIPGATAEDIAEFIEARAAWADAGGASGGGTPFPAGKLAGLERYLARGASAFYTIEVRARTRGGREAGCTALVRLSGRARTPASILAWNGAPLAGSVAAPASAAASAPEEEG